MQHNFIDEVKQLITESRELRNYVVGHTVEFKEMLKEHRNDMKEMITDAFSDIKQK